MSSVDDFHFSQFHKFARKFFSDVLLFNLFLDSNSKALFLGYVKAQENDLPLPDKILELSGKLVQRFCRVLFLL